MVKIQLVDQGPVVCKMLLHPHQLCVMRLWYTLQICYKTLSNHYASTDFLWMTKLDKFLLLRETSQIVHMGIISIFFFPFCTCLYIVYHKLINAFTCLLVAQPTAAAGKKKRVNKKPVLIVSEKMTTEFIIERTASKKKFTNIWWHFYYPSPIPPLISL